MNSPKAKKLGANTTVKHFYTPPPGREFSPPGDGSTPELPAISISADLVPNDPYASSAALRAKPAKKKKR